MFVGVVALCVVLITECHNSNKHSQSPLTSKLPKCLLPFLHRQKTSLLFCALLLVRYLQWQLEQADKKRQILQRDAINMYTNNNNICNCYNFLVNRENYQVIKSNMEAAVQYKLMTSKEAHDSNTYGKLLQVTIKFICN